MEFCLSTSTPIMTLFMDYTFKVTAAGDIIMDEELDPNLLGVKNGDKFEVVIVPAVGIFFKKIPETPK